MPLEQRNFDPATMAGASLSVQLDLGEVLDANNNEVLEFDAVASAVNFVRIANSAAGSAVEVSAQGDDATVQLNLTPKAAGTVRFVTATALSIRTGGDIDFTGIGRGAPIFVVATTSNTPVSNALGLGGTNVNSAWIKIQLSTGTDRYIRVYD